ncbi:MAG TPA: hypothetical protein PLD41_14705, partial [Casimicrobium huifangae]|nr:hypothetical protein [Casimicrobium huifangae]
MHPTSRLVHLRRGYNTGITLTVGGCAFAASFSTFTIFAAFATAVAIAATRTTFAARRTIATFLRRAIDCRLRLCAGGLLNVRCLRFCVCNQRCRRIVAVARRTITALAAFTTPATVTAFTAVFAILTVLARSLVAVGRASCNHSGTRRHRFGGIGLIACITLFARLALLARSAVALTVTVGAAVTFSVTTILPVATVVAITATFVAIAFAVAVLAIATVIAV